MLIEHGTVFTPAGPRPEHTLVISGSRIQEIVPGKSARPGGEQTINAEGRLVVPGFVDVHVHGAAGYDMMDGTPEALATMAHFFARHGVTAFLPTTITASRQATLAALSNVAAYSSERRGGARVLGVHLEGPYVNRAAKGAQPEAHCRLPDEAELAEFVTAGPVRLITLAPEQAGAETFVRTTVARGITVAIGHTTASYEEVRAAADWGARHAAHTYNAMTGLHHRKPGAVGAVLTDERFVAELIADGIHVHPAALALAIRAKGPDHVALVTDAIRATGLPNDVYDLGGQNVMVKNGACWLTDPEGHPTGTLAGSTLTLDVALSNTMRATGLPLVDALPMVTSVPASAAGMRGQLGELAPGAHADVVLLDENYQVVMTIVDGDVVYERT